MAFPKRIYISCSEFFDTTAAMASESHATLHPYVWPTPVSLFMY